MELDPLHDLDIHISNLADTIFYTRNPYGGPNPRGLGESPHSLSTGLSASLEFPRGLSPIPFACGGSLVGLVSPVPGGAPRC